MFFYIYNKKYLFLGSISPYNQSYLIYYSPENSVFFGRYCVQLCLYVVSFLSLIAQFFTRNIQDTSTKLSGIICSPPEQIKFEYYDSDSLLWLDKSKKPILHLDLDLERPLPPQSMDGMSGFLHDVSPVCKLAGVHCESVWFKNLYFWSTLWPYRGILQAV